MKHQPYQDWLVADASHPGDALTDEQKATLHEHLQTCPECCQLALAWQVVQSELRRAPQAAPATGFTARWEIRLAAERQRRHRRQGLVILTGSLGLAGILLGLLFGVAWPLLQSPQLLLWGFIYQVLRWLSILRTLGGFSTSLFEVASSALSPVSWLFATGALALLAVLWFVSFRILLKPRRMTIK